jgi:hypothetical protein
VGRILAVAVAVSLCVRGLPAFQSLTPRLEAVIEEALAANRHTNPVDRVHALVALYPLIRGVDPARAEDVLRQAGAYAAQLSEGDTLLTAMLKGAVAGAFAGVAAAFTGMPWWLAPTVPVPGTALVNAGDARDVKARATLAVVEAMAAVDSLRAGSLAASIDAPGARARAFQITLRHWNAQQRVSPLVHEQAQVARTQRAVAVFGGLARGLATSDPSLGLDLLRQGLALSRQSEPAPADESYMFEALAELDADGAARELKRLVGSSPPAEADRLLAFAGGVMRHRPQLAWRALNAATEPTDTNQGRLMRLGAMLRPLGDASAAPDDELEAFGLELLKRAARDQRGRVQFGIPSTAGVVAAIDATSLLTTLDAERAKKHVEETVFPAYLPRMILGRMRLGQSRQFLTGLLRLERALSVRASDPGEFLRVLESFDDTFWSDLATVAFRLEPDLQPASAHSGVIIRTWAQLVRVRVEWPAAGVQLCASNPDACRRTLHQFTRVAEWLDAEAADRLAGEEKHRSAWVEYLPLTLATAAEALAPVDPDGADRAIQRAMAFSNRLPQPSREWALAANAVTLHRIDSKIAEEGVTEALSLVRRLEERGVGRDWWQWIPSFLQWVSTLDPGTGFDLAKASDPKIRGAALAAVASTLASSKPGVHFN